MRNIVHLTICLSSLLFINTLPATVKQVKIAEYKIEGLTKHHGIVLFDGNLYKILTNKVEASTWAVGDIVLVLRGDHSNRYILVNTRTGEKANAKIVLY
jgi:hypothetical protein